MSRYSYLVLLCVILFCAALSLGLWLPRRTFHQSMGWRAEDYFVDAKAVAFARAIEQDNIELMRRLIADGADVNAKGKKGMTPLLWAFAGDKPGRFEFLLQNGANPNIPLFGDIGHTLRKGESVTEIAAVSSFSEHFALVLKYGGDPNYVNPESSEPLIISLIRRGSRIDERVDMLIASGVELNCQNADGVTAPMAAINHFQQYDLALSLLHAGADYRVHDMQPSRLIHALLLQKERLTNFPPERQTAYRRLLDWLVAHGESIEEAEKERIKIVAARTLEQRLDLKAEMEAAIEMRVPHLNVPAAGSSMTQ